MTTLQAPAPDYATTIILPSCEMGDFRRTNSIVELRKSIVGTPINTFVTNRGEQRTLELDIKLTRYKSWELFRYFEIHGSDKMRLENYDGEEFIGYLKVNPLELEKIKRILVADSEEEVNVKLEFETV